MNGSKKTLGLLLVVVLFALAGCQVPPPTPVVVESAGNTTVLRGLAVINDADIGAQVLTAAIALGQYDWLCGYSDGTRFMEIGRADN